MTNKENMNPSEDFENIDNIVDSNIQKQIDEYMTELFTTIIRSEMEANLPLADNDNNSNRGGSKDVI